MPDPILKELQSAQEVVANLPKGTQELQKFQRHLTPDEAVVFLGLRNRAALTYLLGQPDPPPFIRLTQRHKAFCVSDLVAWSESRKSKR